VNYKVKPWSIVHGQIEIDIFEKKKMRIGEISIKSGLTKDTIRFYEKKGLIDVNRSDSEWNNYKEYSNKNLNRLIFIKKAKEFGFTLKEIAELIELFELNSANCSKLSAKANSKISRIDAKIRELKKMKKMIIDRVIEFSEGCDTINKNGNCKNIKFENKK